MSRALELPIVTQFIVGSFPTDQYSPGFLSIPSHNPLFASCSSNVSLFFSDATTVPPITILNRTAMASAGWQTFNCTFVPQALTFSASRRIMERPINPVRLYIGANKRVFNSSLLSSGISEISSAFDLCSVWSSDDFVLTWNNPNVQGLNQAYDLLWAESHCVLYSFAID